MVYIWLVVCFSSAFYLLKAGRISPYEQGDDETFCPPFFLSPSVFHGCCGNVEIRSPRKILRNRDHVKALCWALSGCCWQQSKGSFQFPECQHWREGNRRAKARIQRSPFVTPQLLRTDVKVGRLIHRGQCRERTKKAWKVKSQSCWRLCKSVL